MRIRAVPAFQPRRLDLELLQQDVGFGVFGQLLDLVCLGVGHLLDGFCLSFGNLELPLGLALAFQLQCLLAFGSCGGFGKRHLLVLLGLEHGVDGLLDLRVGVGETAGHTQGCNRDASLLEKLKAPLSHLQRDLGLLVPQFIHVVLVGLVREDLLDLILDLFIHDLRKRAYLDLIGLFGIAVSLRSGRVVGQELDGVVPVLDSRGDGHPRAEADRVFGFEPDALVLVGRALASVGHPEPVLGSAVDDDKPGGRNPLAPVR